MGELFLFNIILLFGFSFNGGERVTLHSKPQSEISRIGLSSHTYKRFASQQSFAKKPFHHFQVQK